MWVKLCGVSAAATVAINGLSPALACGYRTVAATTAPQSGETIFTAATNPSLVGSDFGRIGMLAVIGIALAALCALGRTPATRLPVVISANPNE
jgi:hypothetical protein